MLSPHRHHGDAPPRRGQPGTLLRNQISAIHAQQADREHYRTLATDVEAFLTILHHRADTATIENRQRVLRLVVKDVLIGPDNITVRHRIPVHHRTRNDTHEPTATDTEGDHRASYPLRWGRKDASLRRAGETAAPAGRSAKAARYLLAGLRLALGWIFLWAFLDKVFGPGYATPSDRSWLNSASPANGFLGSAKGPFSGFYHSIAGTGPADVLFMAALLAIGTALILGIGMRLAAAGGALLTVMMWTAVLPPENNPFMDDHLIYTALLVILALLGAGNTLGFGRAWAATSLVRRATWLK
jgi:thiosulfate dehydrogenase (quinone) large subunit